MPANRLKRKGGGQFWTPSRMRNHASGWDGPRRPRIRECPVSVAAGKTVSMAGNSRSCNTRASSSDFLRLLHDANDAPCLQLRQLARGLDLDQVARLALVGLVVRVILVRLDDDLA